MLGNAPEAPALESYLNAYLDGAVPEAAVAAIAAIPASRNASVTEADVARLRRDYALPPHVPSTAASDGLGSERSDVAERDPLELALEVRHSIFALANTLVESLRKVFICCESILFVGSISIQNLVSKNSLFNLENVVAGKAQ